VRRRRFLKYGLIGGVGMGLGAAVIASQRGRTGAGKALGPSEMGVLLALAEAMHPGSPGKPSAAQLGVPAKIDELMGSIHPDLRDEFSLVLKLIEQPLVGLIFDGALRPFSKRSLAQRQADLNAWRNSRIKLRRAAAKTVVALVNSITWGHRSNWQRVGYPGPPSLGGVHGR